MAKTKATPKPFGRGFPKGNADVGPKKPKAGTGPKKPR